MEGTSFEEDRAAVAAGTVALRRLLGRLHQAGSAELGPVFAELDALRTLSEAAQVGVLHQGLSRGDVRASDAASPAGWVPQWGPSYRAGGAAARDRPAPRRSRPVVSTRLLPADVEREDDGSSAAKPREPEPIGGDVLSEVGLQG